MKKTIWTTANPEVNAALRQEADRIAMDAFVRELLGRVGENTKLKFPTSLREAITTAVAIEHLGLNVAPHQSRYTGHKRKFSQTGLLCFNCHGKGHFSRSCPKRLKPKAKGISGKILMVYGRQKTV